MRKALIQGGLTLGLALVVLVASPAPAAPGGGGHGGSGFHFGSSGGHGSLGGYGSRGGYGGFGHGFSGAAYDYARPTFGFGRGQYPGPRRLGYGWLDKGHAPPVATPLPSPGWRNSGRYGHVRRAHRRAAYQYLACGPYPCAPFGIGFFGPVVGPQVQSTFTRVDYPRYRGTGRYDRYRVD